MKDAQELHSNLKNVLLFNKLLKQHFPEHISDELIQTMEHALENSVTLELWWKLLNKK
jgi:hypothetical protein